MMTDPATAGVEDNLNEPFKDQHSAQGVAYSVFTGSAGRSGNFSGFFFILLRTS